MHENGSDDFALLHVGGPCREHFSDGLPDLTLRGGRKTEYPDAFEDR